MKEIKEGKVSDFAVLPTKMIPSAATLKQQELLKQATESQFVPKETPPDFEFLVDPPSISALDL